MEPSRPSDHVDSAPATEVTQPRLGPLGWLRFFWRQLTTMRTALFLLLLLAVAAVPGSLVPQRSSDPNGVVQFERNNPELFPVLDGLQAFDVYSSAWFSAIYLLLFVSLIGCVVPRTKHHLDALRARPPRTPARLQRLAGYREAESGADAETAVASAARLLRRQGYRVERYSADGVLSVSAERGYLRETGNLVFHSALLGILVSVGILGGLGYSGQKVIVQGAAFTNVLANYDSFNPGRFFDSSALAPFAVRLDDFEAEYALDASTGQSVPLDYTASVTTTLRGGEPRAGEVKVNQPLEIGGNHLYLLGNGFAPVVTIRDAEGAVVYSQPTPFLPQDANLTSLGVIKVPDGLAEQVGLIGFFYPYADALPSGALTSVYPEPENPVLTLQVFTGDLGLDEGVPRSVYSLDTADMTAVAGADSGADALALGLGDSVALPNGLGSIEFSELRRFVSLDIHHDPTTGWVLLFAVLVLAGLLTSLFVPRRRVWVKAIPAAGGIRLEYAALARGEDPTLEAAVADLARRHAAELEGHTGRETRMPE